MSIATEAAILKRIIKPSESMLPPEVAKVVLGWEFSAADRRRMLALLEKAKKGVMTTTEKSSAESYERVGHMLSILKSKARRSLKSKKSL
jgi:hypothetical protein